MLNGLLTSITPPPRQVNQPAGTAKPIVSAYDIAGYPPELWSFDRLRITTNVHVDLLEDSIAALHDDALELVHRTGRLQEARAFFLWSLMWLAAALSLGAYGLSEQADAARLAVRAGQPAGSEQVLADVPWENPPRIILVVVVGIFGLLFAEDRYRR